MRLENTYWLTRLHQHGLVWFQTLQRAQHGVVRVPTARCPTGAAVHHQVVRAFGNVWVKVVLKHSVRGFDLPIGAR